MSKINKKALKSGKVLRYLRDAFLNDQTVMNLSPLFDCLIDSDLYVPMNVIMSNEDINTFKNSNVGDVVSLNNNIRMKPDWLKINAESEELYFPIFSSIDEPTDNYRKNFSWINLSLDDCIKFVRSNEKCIGLVLDAFTKPVVITDKVFNALESILKECRKEENNK